MGLPNCYLYLVTSAVLVLTVTSAYQEHWVRQSQSLCAGELQYVQKRKQIVAEALHQLGINCTMEEVPHIALLGSGGGQRAAVAVTGSLYQLSQDDLLDTMLYLGGVSGSTWTMATMYRDPEWSINMNRTLLTLLSANLQPQTVVNWISQMSQRQDFSLSDVWGVLTTVGITGQWNSRTLSDEAGRNATNPYPVYCAVEQNCFNNGPTEAKWFELSPHEVGFPELGLFVETSLLGSIFTGGHLIYKQPEMDMIQIEGIMTSSLASEMFPKPVPAWLQELGYENSAGPYLSQYNTLKNLITLTKSIFNTTAQAPLDNLLQTLEDKIYGDPSAILAAQVTAQTMQLFQKSFTQLIFILQYWAQALVQDQTVQRQILKLMYQLTPLIYEWEWGTTRNFLYEYKDIPIPECLGSEKVLHLMDAGSFINVGYPSFLGEKRDIDLIITLEMSAGEMFETLTLARAYAAEVKKPFPELDDVVLEAEKDWPRDLYVFEGNNAPTIVYMPIFNRNNTKDAAEYQQKMQQYATFQTSYTSQMVAYLLEAAKANIRNNNKTLLKEINKALQRRRSKN